VIKTLIAGQPHNQHSCNLMKTGNAASGGHPVSNSSCFAIYGFDIMLEDDLSPYVIEVRQLRHHFDDFSSIFQRYAATYAPCDVLYFVCWCAC